MNDYSYKADPAVPTLDYSHLFCYGLETANRRFELRNGEQRCNSFSRLIGDLKLNRTSRFLLADECAITNLSGGNNVLYPQLYEITAAYLAVDR